MASNQMQRISNEFTHIRLDDPPIRLHKYPHLSPSDSAIWDRFLTNHINFFDAVMYDVHVGEGQVPENEEDEAIIRMAIAITQRRIDVLAERQGRIWIVELKQDPGVSVIGQLIAYKTLLLHQDPTLSKPILCAIVNRTDPDLDTIFRVQQIARFIA